MARPSKPAAVLRQEGKSHRTKAELEAREAAEKKMSSSQHIYERKEVKANKTAHAEFTRVRKLMKAINKDDALYSSGINTYCLLYAEIAELQSKRERLKKSAELLNESFEKLMSSGETTMDDVIAYGKECTKLESQDLSIIAAIDKKRKMMLDIDKENVMTISASLRVIPKQPEKEENPLLKILSEE